jgi:hypothetical protein
MRNPFRRASLAACLVAAFVSVPAQAGPAADALSKCVAGSLTKSDRALLAKWIYAAMSAYPDVHASGSAAGRMDDYNRRTAAMFKGMIGKTCNAKAVQAIQTEGNGAVEQSFKLLPEAGIKELLGDPSVAQQLQGLQKYMEEK